MKKEFAKRILSLLLCGALSASLPMPPVMAAKAEPEERAETGASETGSSSLVVKGDACSEGGVIRIGKDGCVTFQNEFRNLDVYNRDLHAHFLGWIENEGQITFESNFINGADETEGAVDNRGQITLRGVLKNGTVSFSESYFKSEGQFNSDNAIYNSGQLEVQNGTIRGEIQNTCELTLQNCTISGGITAKEWSSVVEIKDCLLDGIINCTGNLPEEDYATLKIDNTLLSDTSYTQINAQYTNITMTGGRYRCKDDGNGSGEIVLLKDGTLEIGDGVDISSAGVPVRLLGNTELTLNGGRIVNSSESGGSDLDRLAISISPCEELPAQLGQIRTQLQSTLENGAVLGISSDGGISRTYRAEQEGDHWNLVEIGESPAEVAAEADPEQGLPEAALEEGLLPEDADGALTDVSDQAAEDAGEEQESGEATEPGQDSVNSDKATEGDEVAEDGKVTGDGEATDSDGTDPEEAENSEEERMPSQDALLPEKTEDQREEEAAKDGGSEEEGEAEPAENEEE